MRGIKPEMQTQEAINMQWSAVPDMKVLTRLYMLDCFLFLNHTIEPGVQNMAWYWGWVRRLVAAGLASASPLHNRLAQEDQIFQFHFFC